MNVADLIEAPSEMRRPPGTCPLRPGELAAPRTVDVRSDELDRLDVVVVGDRHLEVVAILNRIGIDGTVRVALSDGSRHICAPGELWEVCRG